MEFGQPYYWFDDGDDDERRRGKKEMSKNHTKQEKTREYL